MQKITYLFGAGASCNALPLVKEIEMSMINLKLTLASSDLKLSSEEKFRQDSTNTKQEVLDFFIRDLIWLIEKAGHHASIDTFAKKLYLKKQSSELLRLKATFSAYLILIQCMKVADNRYDSFYASILSDSWIKFPENIRILSWNYDLQFEKSFSEYSDDDQVIQNQIHLNVISKFSNFVSNINRFTIFKLNGSSTMIGNDEQHKSLHNSFSNTLTREFLEKVIRNYDLVKSEDSQYKSGLSFAWENHSDSKENSVLNLAKNATFDTSVLIVIGYSFPYFNREIDKSFLSNMKNLKKVYFQSPDAENIRERFLTIMPELKEKELILKNDVNQFLLPNEL